MFKAIKEFFTGKPAEVVAEVPYKVEAVVDTADIAIAQLPDPAAVEAVVVVPAAVVPAAIVEAVTAKKTPAVKKPRAPKAPAVVKTLAVKKPRAPKAPK
jgi:hypothetical protein